MRNTVKLLALLLFSINVHAGQVSDSTKGVKVIFLPEYYKQMGVIFTPEYDLNIDLGDITERYSPSIDEIKRAESIFFRDYTKVTNQSIHVKEYFRNYLRQYVGYVDSKGIKKLMMKLIDNSKPRRMKRILGKGWESRYVSYLSDDNPFSYIVVTIDLDKDQLVK